MKKIRALVVWGLVVGLSFAAATAVAGEAEAERGEEAAPVAAEAGVTGDVIDHGPFEELLKKYVDGRGMVDYGRWHGALRDRRQLAQYVNAIGSASVEGKSEAAQLAFYLNAYNALVLHDVLQRWPVESVLREEGFFDGKKHRVAGREMTLNELEHDKVIRVQFAEPRIHFVLVCAAKDCPRLRTTVLTEQNLEAELAAATAEFVPGATRLVGENRVETSQLFNWFAEDFVKDAGSVAAYLAQNVTDRRLRQVLRTEGVEVTFAEYDWAINAP